MTQDEQKRAVAVAALASVAADEILGVGTGSTVNFFIDELAAQGPSIRAAVSSSNASTERLRGHGIEVIDLNQVDAIATYVDGADECDPNRCLIKGGGGALTREKILAEASREFVCIVDQSKLVDCLGDFPLPIEVIPMASRAIARTVATLGGEAQLRPDFITDNGNQILDVRGLKINEPLALERELNEVPGIVTVGLFARRPADRVLVGGADGVSVI